MPLYSWGIRVTVSHSQVTETTQLLQAWQQGDRGALERLTPRVYEELRRRARIYMKNERRGHTLQATALVHEVYMRLIDVTSVNWQDRAHFFAVAATMMRRILVDAARARASAKRGGALQQVDLDAIPDAGFSHAHHLLAVDGALGELAKIDLRKAQVIEMRFFGGLSVEETAEVLKISPQSVMRDWKLAKAWLTRELDL